MPKTWRANEVIPDFLWMGDKDDAYSKGALQQNGITHVLNCADDVDCFFPNDFEYLQLFVKDCGEDAGISRVFEEAKDFIEKCKEEKGKVLVHCYHGMNRSATVIIAYLMMSEHICLQDAKNRVNSVNRSAYPGEHNLDELVKFEEERIAENERNDNNWDDNNWGAGEVIPDFLWLGDKYDASSKGALQEKGITHVLNCADDVDCFFPNDFEYAQLHVKDYGEDAGISRVFEEAKEFIEKCKEEKGKVLVHCYHGMNRSVTVTIALVMMLEGITLKNSLFQVNNVRSTSIDWDNVVELINFEKKIRKKTSVTTTDFYS